MAALTHQPETSHAHYSFQKQSQPAKWANQYLTVMRPCPQRSSRAPDTEENQIFIPAFGPIRDSGPIAEPSRVRREDLSNMSFN